MEELKAQILDLPQINVKIENVEVNNAVKGDYIPTPETAEIGQTVVVKSVDENGKPVEWEAADFPEGDVDVDWKDIKNKPFDNDIYEWQEVNKGFSSNTYTDVTRLDISLSNPLLIQVGSLYKVVIKDREGLTPERQFEGVGNADIYYHYCIGTPEDGNYAQRDHATATRVTIYLTEPISTNVGFDVFFYEQVKVIDPLPAEYLPEIPVEKLPQIPAEKLPEDIGGEVSWDNIKDKPFGGSAFEWVENAVGTYSSTSMTPMTSFTANFSGTFPNIVDGKTYQVEIISAGTVTKRFTGIGRVIQGAFFPSYAIGLDTDPNRATIPMGKNSITVYLDTSVVGMVLTVKIYEGVETIKPIPYEYLPETLINDINDLYDGMGLLYEQAKGFQTAEQVNALINEALGVVENGTY